MATKADLLQYLLRATLSAFLLLSPSLAVDYVPDTGSQGQCEYKFTVRSPVDCSVSDPGLKETVRLMKQDIDMTRISAVSHNSAVQEQIATLKDVLIQLEAELKEVKASRLVPEVFAPDIIRDEELAEVKDEVKELGERLSTLLDNVENQVMYMQKYLSTLNSTITSEKVERFRIESNIQAQLNSMSGTLTDVQKRILTLEKVVSEPEMP